ncbi:hypothetical protein GLA29479_4208 [Lysobacter antibioticus]|nr:hypothetical protein GLA29479_4208 [Lysobacter antibioticus]
MNLERLPCVSRSPSRNRRGNSDARTSGADGAGSDDGS